MFTPLFAHEPLPPPPGPSPSQQHILIECRGMLKTLPEVTAVLCQSNPPLLEQAETPMRRSRQACPAELHRKVRCRILRSQAARKTQAFKLPNT